MSKHMEIEVEIMGVDFIFDVEYIITSYGTHDTWYEPGDPPELYIDQVINKRTGEDMTDWLDNHHNWLSKTYRPWLTNDFKWHALTWLNELEERIYMLEEFDEGGDKGGYD